jgi:hypothetical protein
MAMTSHSYKHGAFHLLSLSIHAKASSYMSEDPSCTTGSFFVGEWLLDGKPVVPTTFLFVSANTVGLFPNSIPST